MKNLPKIWKVEMKQQPSCSEDQYRVQGAAVSYH